ncbi:pre-rRNA 2'-O-ribose RNA methyltransferase FTSJ3 [Hyalella azteca]|uniref:Putative rRNA methyltransferase n=1 Tax=Hyalella azteca TaxID=294128 RepID=A0A8B7P605_HYAAZ|nr:pre-rRNA 2'-O-ribose RNA methyltransferase FTSJ3 [Hyalella azteca]
MGHSKKKAKTGASRKDGYYKLAKEKGYRARSAFKLVHLNSICDNFFKNAKVCIDLCAAPGSWMQVAREFMPQGSVIVGVDLHPIKAIPKTLSIQGDITTQSLRAELRNTLKNYKADVVLHDGAPNVGKNWTQDAYDQNVLVLHACKLACEFLRYGGHFVTKVFRSKDSTKLEYVFKNLFKDIKCTKPQASRYESAEIFYVCKFYKVRPDDKVDPQFFDAKHVFAEVEPTEAKRVNLNRPEKVKKKSEGYEDGAEILYSESTVTDFIESTRHEELLQKTSKLVIDERWQDHPSLTKEIIACCQDIKVLGRKELKMLLIWRKTLKAEYDALKSLEKDTTKDTAATETAGEAQEDEDEETRIRKQIQELEDKSRAEDSHQKKAVKKQRKQLQQKLKLMALSGSAEVQRDETLFNIKDMERVQDPDVLMAQYDKLPSDDEEEALPTRERYRKTDYELDESGTYYRRVGDVSDSESEDETPEAGEGLFKKKKKKKTILKSDGVEFVSQEDTCKLPKKSVRFADDEDSSDDDSDSSDNDEDLQELRKGEEDEGDDEEAAGEKFTTDLMGDDEEDQKERTAESWFAKNELLTNLMSDDEEDLDLEVSAAIKSYKSKGGLVLGGDDAEDTPESDSLLTSDNNKTNKTKKQEKSEPLKPDAQKSSKDSMMPKAAEQTAVGGVDGAGTTSSKITAKRLADMDAVALALGTKLVKSKKARREIYDDGWNRYMVGGEEDLPAWFVEDERENMAPVLDVDESDVRMFKARDRAVNVRNLKKVMEAKARKQRRFKKTMQKVVKKAEAMQGSGLGDVEKKQEIKNLYKKAMSMTKKRETTYVVMSKRNKGKKPRSVKGRYKLVDARLRKDVRGKMRADARRKKFTTPKRRK